MTRFDDPSKFFDQLEDGIDAAWSEYVQEMQGQLTSRAPIDSGRLASSFYISKGSPSSAVRPDNWAPPGAKKQVLPEYTGKITFSGTWFVTNNVPYAVRVAKDPVWGKNGRGFGSEWYNATVTQIPRLWEQTAAKYLRKFL